MCVCVCVCERVYGCICVCVSECACVSRATHTHSQACRMYRLVRGLRPRIMLTRIVGRTSAAAATATCPSRRPRAWVPELPFVLFRAVELHNLSCPSQTLIKHACHSQLSALRLVSAARTRPPVLPAPAPSETTANAPRGHEREPPLFRRTVSEADAHEATRGRLLFHRFGGDGGPAAKRSTNFCGSGPPTIRLAPNDR